MRIKAAVVRQYGASLAIEPLDVGEPREGEILVRLVASGVARADIDAVAGRFGTPLPFVPGAEAAGFVERVGAGVDSPAPGEAVLLLGRTAAEDAPECRPDGSTPLATADGHPVHGFFFGQSSFSTHLLCRAADALVVDAAAPLELAAILGGEFLRGASPILELEDPDAAVVITGAGFVGLAACLVARARGVAAVVVADPSEARRHRAVQAGATLTVPDDEGLAAVVRSLRSEGAALALEASGSSSGENACRAALAPGGICLAVHDAPAAPILPARDLVSRLAAMSADGSLPLAGLIDFFPFEQINDALAARAAGTAVKPVLRFSLGGFDDLDRALKQGSATDEAGSASETEAAEEEPATATAPVTA